MTHIFMPCYVMSDGVETVKWTVHEGNSTDSDCDISYA